MAEFNPPLQLINDPDYTRKSSPISVPDPIKPQGQSPNQILPHGVREGDRSGEYAGKAAAAGLKSEAVSTAAWGDIFSGITKGADFLIKVGDTMIKKDIENQVYAQANAEREQYTEALETLRYGPGGTQSVIESTGTSTNLPDELKNLSKTVGSLSGANSAGKISNTMYVGRLNALAKDLRSRYPGYRQYIDQQFASVTGMNPANAYIESLTKDLNAAAQNATQSRGKIEGLIIDQIKDGNRAASVAWEGYRAGVFSESQVINMITPHIIQKADMDRRKAIRAEAEASREDVSRQAEEDLTVLATRTVSNEIETFRYATGTDTSQGLFTIIERAGRGLYNQQQIQEIGRQLRARLPMIQETIRKGATEPGINGTSPMIQQLKGKQDDVNRITKAVTDRYLGFIDAIEKGDLALASIAANEIKSMTADGTVKVMKDPNLGPPIQASMVLRQALGDTAMGHVAQRLVVPTDIPNQLKGFFEQGMVRGIAQPDKAKTGVPVTIKDVIQGGRREGINNANMNRQLINKSVELLTDPKMPETGKVNLAEFLFAPENRGFLNNVAADGRTSDGRIIPGKWYTFRDMTSPEVTKIIGESGKKDSKTLANYKDWTQLTFRDLFVRDLMDLNQFKEIQGIRVTWNSDTKQLGVSDAQPVESSTGGRITTGYATSIQEGRNRQISAMKERVRLLNMGLASIAETAPLFNTDVEGYIMQTLMDAGYQPSSNDQGFPSDIQRALINSKIRQESKSKRREDATKEFEGK